MLQYLVPVFVLVLAMPAAATPPGKCDMDRFVAVDCREAHATCRAACDPLDAPRKGACRDKCDKAERACLTLADLETLERRHHDEYLNACMLLRNPEVFSTRRERRDDKPF